MARPDQLTGALWGDWALSPKDKRVVRIKRRGGGADAKAKPLFVQLVLEAVWKVGGLGARRGCIGGGAARCLRSAGASCSRTCVEALRIELS